MLCGLSCCLSYWLCVCWTISPLFSISAAGGCCPPLGEESCLGPPGTDSECSSCWEHKACWNDAVRIWLLFGCVSQMQGHARTFSMHNSRSLPALQRCCQATVSQTQVEGIVDQLFVLNCSLDLGVLSSRNLDGIFRPVQLLLSTQHSRDLWTEPVRNSCSFTRLASAKSCKCFLASSADFGCSYQWVGHFAATTNLKRPVLQRWVRLRSRRHLGSPQVLSGSPTAPCVSLD